MFRLIKTAVHIFTYAVAVANFVQAAESKLMDFDQLVDYTFYYPLSLKNRVDVMAKYTLYRVIAYWYE